MRIEPVNRKSEKVVLGLDTGNLRVGKSDTVPVTGTGTTRTHFSAVSHETHSTLGTRRSILLQPSCNLAKAARTRQLTWWRVLQGGIRWRGRRRRRPGVVLTRIRVVCASFDGGHVGMHDAVLFELVVVLFVSNEGSRARGWLTLCCLDLSRYSSLHSRPVSFISCPCRLLLLSSFVALAILFVLVELGGGRCWRTWRDTLVLGSFGWRCREEEEEEEEEEEGWWWWWW